MQQADSMAIVGLRWRFDRGEAVRGCTGAVRRRQGGEKNDDDRQIR
jgi:hypothetical protein